MAKTKSKRITSIGGQALIEGIMMRGPQKTAAAFVSHDGKVTAETFEVKTLREKYRILNLPLLRGTVTLIDSLRIGMKMLNTAADRYMEDVGEEEEPGRFEAWLNRVFGEKVMDVMMSAATVLALGQSPVLLAGRSLAVQEDDAPQPDPEPEPEPENPAPAPSEDPAPQPGADNGVPAQTVDPRSTDGYSIINGVYIKNKSSRTLDPAVLGDRQFAACPQQGPQVLIVHSHASESYTMPPGQEYVPSGTFRTADRSCNMVRVGDELAAELSSYGISVVHDRTLHDGESYNDAYENSLASIQSYLAKYPSIVYVLDLHRDAVQDANGTQYKLVTAEDPAAAQVSLIMGVAHDGWQDNLRLAIAVQEKLESQSPTLMRPITLLNYRYNQFAAPGSLLVEVGAAGNSLDEALRAARLFAKGFAETILGR